MSDKATTSSSIKNVVIASKFYKENDKCPTCTQAIEPTFKQGKVDSLKTEAIALKNTLDTLQEQAEEITENLDKWTKAHEEIRKKQSDVHSNNKNIEIYQDQISEYNNDISRLTSREGDLSTANSDLLDMRTQHDQYMESRFELNEQYSYNSVMSEMLKDTGIKTKVIKQYIPVINKLVNQYLQVLDFFVHFNLDESFQETIRSRHRDAFSYDSFSEGEKQRIDLALLFTWRMIAKMKNSVATNLLILDETFDSSLDHDGVDNLMKNTTYFR